MTMEWISVKECLPETDEWVLVKRDDEYVSFGCYSEYDDWSHLDVWVTNNDYPLVDTDVKILWWAKVPKQPKIA